MKDKMKNSTVVVLSVVGVILLGILLVVGSVISTSNTEVDLRTTIEAKQRDNKSEFDNMFKVISQNVQVTEAQKDALKEIFIEHAEARNNKSGGSLATWVQESVPNVDVTVYNNLMNIITSKRDAWTMRQKEILDLNREHTALLRRFPSGFILGMLGRKEMDVTIITSDKTEKAFETGKDNDTDLFKKE